MKDMITSDKDQNLPMVSIIIMIRISLNGISLNPLHTQDDHKILGSYPAHGVPGVHHITSQVTKIQTCPWCPSYAGGGTAQAWQCPCWQTWSLLDIMIMVITDKSLMNCIWWRPTCTDLYVGVGYESFQARSWVVVLLHLRLRRSKNVKSGQCHI